jgi:lysophospholipase L1-like esterase
MQPFAVDKALIWGVAIVAVGMFFLRETSPQPADRWEQDIAAFEAADRESPPAAEAVLFVGSSSIRLWDLARSFPGLATLNRGFGGSQIADVNRYVPRIVLAYQPGRIVFYAGDNDINAGKAPVVVAADFRRFVELVWRSLPEAEIVYVPIKPSLDRWEQFADQQVANAAIRAMCEADPRLNYVDTVTPMLGSDGRPRPELFVDDGLHLSATGYELWSGLVAAALER